MPNFLVINLINHLTCWNELLMKSAAVIEKVNIVFTFRYTCCAFLRHVKSGHIDSDNFHFNIMPINPSLISGDIFCLLIGRDLQ